MRSTWATPTWEGMTSTRCGGDLETIQHATRTWPGRYRMESVPGTPNRNDAIPDANVAADWSAVTRKCAGIGATMRQRVRRRLSLSRMARGQPGPPQPVAAGDKRQQELRLHDADGGKYPHWHQQVRQCVQGLHLLGHSEPGAAAAGAAAAVRLLYKLLWSARRPCDRVWLRLPRGFSVLVGNKFAYYTDPRVAAKLACSGPTFSTTPSCWKRARAPFPGAAKPAGAAKLCQFGHKHTGLLWHHLQSGRVPADDLCSKL